MWERKERTPVYSTSAKSETIKLPWIDNGGENKCYNLGNNKLDAL